MAYIDKATLNEFKISISEKFNDMFYTKQWITIYIINMWWYKNMI